MKVLVAIDGEVFAKAITDILCSHRWEQGACFRLINVCHLCYCINGSSINSDNAIAADETLLQETRELINKSIPGVNIECVTRSGDPSEELLAECKAWKPDLLVMGSHGQKYCGRSLLGSVSHFLINHIDCSALIVRLPADVSQQIIISAGATATA